MIILKTRQGWNRGGASLNKCRFIKKPLSNSAFLSKNLPQTVLFYQKSPYMRDFFCQIGKTLKWEGEDFGKVSLFSKSLIQGSIHTLVVF